MAGAVLDIAATIVTTPIRLLTGAPPLRLLRGSLPAAALSTAAL